MSYDGNFRPKAIPKRMNQQGVQSQVDKSKPGAAPILTDDLSNQSLQPEGARTGDNMIDRPKGLPKSSPVSENCAAADSSFSPDEEKVDLKIDDLLYHSAINTHGLLRSSFWILALTLILALLLLYISSHAISILHDALALPVPGRWVAICLLSVLVGVIGYVMGRALFFTRRLSRGSQLSIDQLVSMSNFTGLRSYRIAKEEFLQPYLNDLISRPPKTLNKFLQMNDADKVIESAHRLLDSKRRLGSREWVDEFVEKIQLPMAALAAERINGYAKATALKTAISPWPFVDMASVIYNATLMITDLAIIFNRRFSRGNSIRILMGMFFAIFIAGQAQEALDTIEDEFGQRLTAGGSVEPDAVNIDDHVNTFAESAFENLGHGALIFTKFSSKKIAEGATSWLLMKRLGRRAVKMLKPIAGTK
ncbi:MAG: DUF697 domain-containing protein [Pseudomonadota bacterium]|nr:DUF697 domain-containing protein [Pseudomonadota bacterium]